MAYEHEQRDPSQSGGCPDGTRTTDLPPLRELEQRIQDATTLTPEQVQRQRKRGKLTVRERVDLLVDPGSFLETGALREPGEPELGEPRDQPGDGVVAGTARIGTRPVAVYAQDFTVQGGSLGAAHAERICDVLDRAISERCPVVGINDSGGARIQEGVRSLAGYGEIFRRNVEASGLVPQITIVAGPCAGGAVYSPALTDLVIMVEDTSYMFLTGPSVVETVTGEDVDKHDLGGARTHGSRSGVAHLVAGDEAEAYDLARRVLSYLPRSTDHPLPIRDGDAATPYEDPALDGIVPSDDREPYPVDEVVHRIVDDARFLEFMEDWAPQARVGLARMGGIPVGIVANDPRHLAGALDRDASVKMARFIRFCDSFNLPVVTLVDVPGFLPGTDQEWNGIIRHGAKLVHAYVEATVPTITVVLRKAYGGGYIAMGSQHLGTDVNLAWPTAQIAVMGARGAVRILHRREVQNAPDPAARSQALQDEYDDTFLNPYRAAADGYVDEVIPPRATRPRIVRWLQRLQDKHRPAPEKRHGNIPL